MGASVARHRVVNRSSASPCASFAIKFAVVGGGIWKAAGVLCIVFAAIALVTVLLGIISAVAGSNSGAYALGGIAGVINAINLFVLLAFWIVTGIGLISAAGNLERQVA